MNKIIPGAILLFAIFFSSNSCFGEATIFDHKIELKNMVFEWKLEKEMITIRISAKTTGWVGIGFNPTVEMKDANFIIGYVKEGKVKVTDHFGITNRQHQNDTKIGGKKNITNITGSEKNKVTEIGFTLPLNSGDPKDQVLYPDKETVVLLAHGSGRDSFRAKHQFRTSLKVNLKTGKYTKLK